MGYSIKHAYNGWAALAAAVLAGCSPSSKQAMQESAQDREAAFTENQRIAASVRQTFANTQRQTQVQARVQPRFQALSAPVAQAPVPFELDPRDYAPDSRPPAPPQIRPIVATVPTPSATATSADSINTNELAAHQSPVPATTQQPALKPARLTLVTAESDATSTLPVPIDLVDARAQSIASVHPIAAAPQNASPTSSAPENSPGLTVDANGNLKSFTLRRPPSPAFLAAPNTLRSVTIDRFGHVTAWEPVTGPTRASGLIRKNIVTDPKSPRVELLAEPNPNARSESAHPGLVFTPLADGSLVYTCE